MARTAAIPRATSLASRRRGIWRLVFLLIILAIIGSYISPVRDYVDRTKSINEEQSTTNKLQEQHDELQVEKERLGTNAYVEEVARRDLGLVRSGEQPYVVKDLSKNAPKTPPQPAAPEEKSLKDRVLGALRSLAPW